VNYLPTIAIYVHYRNLEKPNEEKETFEEEEEAVGRVKHQWLTPIILTTWEAKIERIAVQGQPGQIIHKTLSTNSWAEWYTPIIPHSVGG
jgi:hypothetical protein